MGSTPWRLVEWSVVFGGLCWLFVQLWTDKPFEKPTPHPRPPHRAATPRWWSRWTTRATPRPSSKKME